MANFWMQQYQNSDAFQNNYILTQKKCHSDAILQWFMPLNSNWSFQSIICAHMPVIQHTNFMTFAFYTVFPTYKVIVQEGMSLIESAKRQNNWNSDQNLRYHAYIHLHIRIRSDRKFQSDIRPRWLESIILIEWTMESPMCPLWSVLCYMMVIAGLNTYARVLRVTSRHFIVI